MVNSFVYRGVPGSHGISSGDTERATPGRALHMAGSGRCAGSSEHSLPAELVPVAVTLTRVRTRVPAVLVHVIGPGVFMNHDVSGNDDGKRVI